MNGSSYDHSTACCGRCGSHALCLLRSFSTRPAVVDDNLGGHKTESSSDMQYLALDSRKSSRTSPVLQQNSNAGYASRWPCSPPAQLAQRADMDEPRLRARKRCDENTSVPLSCAVKRLIRLEPRVGAVRFVQACASAGSDSVAMFGSELVPGLTRVRYRGTW